MIDQLNAKIKEQDRSITTILITGWEIEETNARRQGFDFYFQKPFVDLEKLKGMVAKGIALRDARLAQKTQQRMHIEIVHPLLCLFDRTNGLVRFADVSATTAQSAFRKRICALRKEVFKCCV